MKFKKKLFFLCFLLKHCLVSEKNHFESPTRRVFFLSVKQKKLAAGPFLYHLHKEKGRKSCPDYMRDLKSRKNSILRARYKVSGQVYRTFVFILEKKPKTSKNAVQKKKILYRAFTKPTVHYNSSAVFII